MEKFEHKEYRDELADKLKEIRNSNPENTERAHIKAQGYLEAQQETDEYKKAEKNKLTVEYYNQIINEPFDIRTCQKLVRLYYKDYFDKLDRQLTKEEQEELQSLLDRIYNGGLKIRRFSELCLDFDQLKAYDVNEEYNSVKEKGFQIINVPKYKEFLSEYLKDDIKKIKEIFSSKRLYLGVGSTPSVIFDPYYIHCEECGITPMLGKLDSILSGSKLDIHEIRKASWKDERSKLKNFYFEHKQQFMDFLGKGELTDAIKEREKQEEGRKNNLKKFDPQI